MSVWKKQAYPEKAIKRITYFLQIIFLQIKYLLLSLLKLEEPDEVNANEDDPQIIYNTRSSSSSKRRQTIKETEKGFVKFKDLFNLLRILKICFIGKGMKRKCSYPYLTNAKKVNEDKSTEDTRKSNTCRDLVVAGTSNNSKDFNFIRVNTNSKN